MEYNRNLFCPMVNSDIPIDECIENCDIANGLFHPDGIKKQYGNKLVENWRDVCMKCKYHEM